MATTDSSPTNISPFRARSGADDASPRPPAAPAEPARPRTLPSHPFGDLIKQHLSRRHGLSQNKLAEGIDQDAAVIADMCHGRRLRGPQARARVLAIIGWLHAQQALATPEEADALLAAAGHAALQDRDPAEGALLHSLHGDIAAPAPTQPAARPPRAGILPPLPALVLGRSEALRELTARLSRDGAAPGHPPGQRLTVVRGWPGVGKTTLAACLAHDDDLAALFPDGVLWAALGPHPQVLGELAAWGRALALEGLARLSEVAEISRHLARHLADKRMLLIVDDVWEERDARPFMVGGRGCAVLLTTRLPRVAEALAPTPAAIYPLPVLAASAALELLGALAPAVVRAHPAACRDLVRELEGLPLALQVAGHLLQAEARLGWGVSELLAELRSGVGLLDQEAPPDLLDLDSQTIPTVAVLLRRSTERLDAVTRERFALLGAFPPKPATFDPEALAAVWAVADPRPTVRALVERGLLEPVGAGRFQLHALLVLHARELLTE